MRRSASGPARSASSPSWPPRAHAARPSLRSLRGDACRRPRDRPVPACRRRIRSLVRRPGARVRYGAVRARGHVGDDIRGLRAVRRRVDPRRRGHRCGCRRGGGPPQRALRPDERRRRAELPRPGVAALLRVTADRGRVVGACGARRRALRRAVPPRSGADALPGVGLRNGDRSGRGRPGRRPRAAGARRRVPGALPRAAGGAGAERAGPRGGAPRRGDRRVPRAGRAGRRADHRRRGRLPDRSAEVSAVWTVVAVVGAATIAFKALGPVGLAGRELPRSLAGVLGLLAPAVLAALVVTSAAGDWRRVLGLAAAAVAVLLRAPLLVVVIVAAVVAAGARALT